MLKVLVVGAGGRMGNNILNTIAANPETRIAYALVIAEDPKVGTPLLQDSSVVYSADLAACTDFDVAIDFSAPQSTLQTLEHCRKLGKALVIGTTGFKDAEKEVIAQAAQEIPVVFSANYSVGMNLMFKLVEKAAKIMGDYADIEIIEAHHHHKVDAPSGTALALGQHICNAMGTNLNDVAVKERNGLIGPRTKGEIGFSTIRAADVIGEHNVWFADLGERIELMHKVSDRVTFARGAVRAAQWVAQQPVGLYDMTKVLGLDQL